jgi:hypothetical protein
VKKRVSDKAAIARVAAALEALKDHYMAVSGSTLDWDYINRWCQAQGTRSLLEEIRRAAGLKPSP